MQTLIEAVGLLDDLEESEAEEMYSPLRSGLCMTCRGPLGDTTLLLVNEHGIVGGYCGGACLQDMTVLGWIQEQHDDIRDTIAFRGGKGDEAE